MLQLFAHRHACSTCTRPWMLKFQHLPCGCHVCQASPALSHPNEMAAKKPPARPMCPMCFPGAQMLEEMAANVPKEFDFLREAHLMRVIGRRLAASGVRGVVIPEPLLTLSSPQLLVMQRMPGGFAWGPQEPQSEPSLSSPAAAMAYILPWCCSPPSQPLLRDGDEMHALQILPGGGRLHRLKTLNPRLSHPDAAALAIMCLCFFSPQS